MEPINCQDMVTRVNEESENRTKRIFTDAQVLRVIDEATQHLYVKQQENFKDHDLDYVDVDLTAVAWAGTFADTGQDIREFRLPNYIHRIRRIEDISNTDKPVEITHTSLQEKEQSRIGATRQMTWVWTKRSNYRGRIGFIGGTSSLTVFRIWFTRRHPPLQYGVVRNGLMIDGSGTPAIATIQLDHTPTRAGLDYTVDAFIGALIQFTAVDVSAGAGAKLAHNIDGQIRRIDSAVLWTDLVATPPLKGIQVALDEALTNSVIVNDTQYALIPQIDPEHHELVILMAALKIAKRIRSIRNIQALNGVVPDLYENFLEATTSRQAQTQDSVVNLDDVGDFS